MFKIALYIIAQALRLWLVASIGIIGYMLDLAWSYEVRGYYSIGGEGIIIAAIITGAWLGLGKLLKDWYRWIISKEMLK